MKQEWFNAAKYDFPFTLTIYARFHSIVRSVRSNSYSDFEQSRVFQYP